VTKGENIDLYKVLLWKSQGRSHGKHRRRWEANIKIGLQKIICRRVEWIDFAQDEDKWRALANSIMKLPVS
jgi:hypothetical protein